MKTYSIPNSLILNIMRDKLVSRQRRSDRHESHRQVPVEFGAFQRLNIDLAANKINALPLELCGKSEWMHGVVGLVAADLSCDAILCRPGTYAPYGKQTHKSDACLKCASLNEAPFYGSTACLDPKSIYEREGKLADKY